MKIFNTRLIRQSLIDPNAQHFRFWEIWRILSKIRLNYGRCSGFSMGLKEKLLVVVPLAIFGIIIFGFAIFNIICKNGNSIFDC